MYSRSGTTTSTKSCSEQIEKLKYEIKTADAIVIGAGAGLSASAGFTYTGERFEKFFGDFIEKYGFSDMYSGGFYPFETLEEHWAYWSRYIYINRYMDAPKPIYNEFLRLVDGKDYFVLTTNVDHCFQKAGFDKSRLFYTQGDYGLWQCSKPCHQKTYHNETVVRKMLDKQENRKIPGKLVPYCPVCGAPMAMNLRTDMTFVEDEGSPLRGFPAPPYGTAYPLSGTGRRQQYSCYHQISVLEDDLSEPENGLRLHQSGRSCLPRCHRKTIYLYQYRPCRCNNCFEGSEK